MIGDKVCFWLSSHFPLLTKFVGSLSEPQLIGFTIGLMLLAYALCSALWNGWLVLANSLITDDEPYEDWMEVWGDPIE